MRLRAREQISSVCMCMYYAIMLHHNVLNHSPEEASTEYHVHSTDTSDYF